MRVIHAEMAGTNIRTYMMQCIFYENYDTCFYFLLHAFDGCVASCPVLWGGWGHQFTGYRFQLWCFLSFTKPVIIRYFLACFFLIFDVFCGGGIITAIWGSWKLDTGTLCVSLFSVIWCWPYFLLIPPLWFPASGWVCVCVVLFLPFYSFCAPLFCNDNLP